LFKVRFLPMSSDQIARAYRDFFGFDPPSQVLNLSGLTPADFATVLRKATALGEHGPTLLTRWLEHEALAKPDANASKDWLLIFVCAGRSLEHSAQPSKSRVEARSC
jgi:hypothetical protein